jgi:hypothetical protein
LVSVNRTDRASGRRWRNAGDRGTGKADASAPPFAFGDIEGKLDVLRVECTKCARKGRYHVHKLIEKYGRKANMMK